MDSDGDTNELHVPHTETPPTYVRVEPRYFGVTPHLTAGALAVASLLAGVALLAAAQPAVGVLLLVAGVLLAALFAEQARRRRSSSLDRAVAAAVDRSLALAGFTRATVGAWSVAGRRAARLRLEARRLARQRSHVQYDLGGAVHAEDAERTAALRARMRSLDAEIERHVREARAAIDHAKTATRHERGAVAATRVRRPGSSAS